MKLIFAIVGKSDSHAVQDALTSSGFSVTRLSTTGGFLKAGNVTFLIGVENDKVNAAVDIIRKYCSKRTQAMPDTSVYGDYPSMPIEVTVGGATIFVLDVERFEKL
ncbi:MAG TPA: transcriptional regulator [Clostridiales bacterium]|nr:transcriptional regulator [Clostridiales bacterium]